MIMMMMTLLLLMMAMIMITMSVCTRKLYVHVFEDNMQC